VASIRGADGDGPVLVAVRSSFSTHCVSGAGSGRRYRLARSGVRSPGT
jgi:hypothetical protein